MALIKYVSVVITELLLPRCDVGVPDDKYIVSSKHWNLFAVRNSLNDEVGEELVVFLLPVQDKTGRTDNNSGINGTSVVIAVLSMNVLKSGHCLNRLAKSHFVCDKRTTSLRSVRNTSTLIRK